VIFSSNIIKTLKSSRDRAKEKRERERKKVKGKNEEEKEKLQESLQIKGKLIFWEEENTSTSKILFDVIPFSPTPSYHFKNPFQNYWESFFKLFLDHPLAWQYTWLELYPFPLPMRSTYLSFRG
jgi:hypothetical protein